MNVGISLEMLILLAKNLLFQEERPGKNLVFANSFDKEKIMPS